MPLYSEVLRARLVRAFEPTNVNVNGGISTSVSGQEESISNGCYNGNAEKGGKHT